MSNKAGLFVYLNFDGNTREAMEFYHSVFGGKLAIHTFGEFKMAKNESEENLVMHASIENEYLTLMASEGKPGSKVIFGDNVSLSLNGTDSDLITQWFNALAKGGAIDMPLEKQFWGDTFGMLTDKFGVHWMANISEAK